MTRAAAILFDLDGTLLDTAPDMVGALNRLRIEEGREPLPFAAVRTSVSHGAVRLIAVGFPDAAGRRVRTAATAIPAASTRTTWPTSTRLFPGLEAVLQRFEADGLPWGVVTNKPGLAHRSAARAARPRAARLLRRERRHRRRAQAASRCPCCTPRRSRASSPDRCVYVGDAERDIVAGRAAGMQTVVAAYGYLGAEDDPAAWAAARHH